MLRRFLSLGWLCGSRPERELVDEWMDAISIKATGSGALISTLSGGNQQKVMMAAAWPVTRACWSCANPRPGGCGDPAGDL